MKRLTVLFAAVLASCLVVSAQGCSTGGATTATTGVTRPDGGVVTSGSGGPEAVDAQAPATATNQPKQSDGVLGAAADAVVTTVLLPFRIIGNTLGLIII